MARIGEEVGCTRHFHDEAEIHDDDLVAEMPDDAEIMADEQHGQAELGLDLHEQVD